MKSKCSVLAIAFFVLSSTAQAKPIIWTGPASYNGDDSAFSMSLLIGEAMYDLSSAYGMPVPSARPNSAGGITINYTGEGSNRIACFTAHPASNTAGFSECIISGATLTDGPLTRNLVARELATHTAGSRHKANGVWIMSKSQGQIQNVMYYTDGRTEGFQCIYKGSQNAILWAQCFFR